MANTQYHEGEDKNLFSVIYSYFVVLPYIKIEYMLVDKGLTIEGWEKGRYDSSLIVLYHELKETRPEESYSLRNELAQRTLTLWEGKTKDDFEKKMRELNEELGITIDGWKVEYFFYQGN